MEPTRQEVEGGTAAAMVPHPRRPRRGRQRIQIRFIDNKERRQVTFSKRRMGLFKKASELVLFCGARVAVVVFSTAEKPKAFAIGAPSVEDVIRAYAPLPGEEGAWLLQDDDADAACRAAVEAALRQAEETNKRAVAEQARINAIGEKMMQAVAGRRFWWEVDVDQLGEAELPVFARALQQLRYNVHHHAQRLSRRSVAPLPLQ